MLGDIAQPGEPLSPMETGDLSSTVFLELIAPMPERVEPALEMARKYVVAGHAAASWRPGLSPHAPYSVHPDLLAGAVSLSADERIPLAFHLAESPEEMRLLRHGAGPLAECLREMGAWHPETHGGGRRPLDYLRTLAAADRALVVHGNYLDDEEIALLAERPDTMSVVYCPRTHAYFGHRAYPLAAMLSAGVTVALGTDSRASSPDLSVLAEMRHVVRNHPTVALETVLAMGTRNAAKALGRDHETGSLEPGKYADLTIVALPDNPADPYDLLFRYDRPVLATYFRGRQVFSHRMSS
jgi:cytosine/adenosine deaminase-related metal-dependent hydrolase